MSGGSLDDHIVSTPGTCGGRPRIAGRRIRVQDIVIWHELQKMSAAQIASDFELTLGDVHAALAYYFDHKQEIDQRMRDDEAFIEEMMAKHPSRVLQLIKERQLSEIDDNGHESRV